LRLVFLLVFKSSRYSPKLKPTVLPTIEKGPFEGTGASLQAYKLHEWFRDKISPGSLDTITI